MFGGKASKPQNRIDSFIGEGTTVEGNVMFSGGLRIDGKIRACMPAEQARKQRAPQCARAGERQPGQKRGRSRAVNHSSVRRYISAFAAGRQRAVAALPDA